MKAILFLLLLLPNFNFSQDSPSEIVTYMFTSLTNGQVQNLIPIMANSELRKTKELQNSLDANEITKADIIKQYRTIKSWKITSSKEHTIDDRNLTIVSTMWVMAIPLEKNPNIVKGSKEINSETLYVDYMLEQFNGVWKIISSRTRN